jgi:HEAT repeat protein
VRLARFFCGTLLAGATLGCSAPSRVPSEPAPDRGIVISSGHEPPPGTPYPQWEHHEHLGLLKSNGFSEERGTWANATRHGEPAIRAAACALLAEAPRAEDRAVLETAARDRSPRVRAWALLALARLGDTARSGELRALVGSGGDPGEGAALVAAAALARLGDGAGVPVLRAAMRDAGTRLEATRWLFDVARVDPAAAWPLFSLALSDPAPVTRSLALAQLEALRDPRSRPLLEQHAAAGTGDEAERARVRALLAALPAP